MTLPDIPMMKISINGNNSAFDPEYKAFSIHKINHQINFNTSTVESWLLILTSNPRF
jgi:hypothetical protein